MRRIELAPELFAEIAKSVDGDPRGRFRVGETLVLTTPGEERELHIHLSVICQAPKAGDRVRLGITVLPFDIRWNRLWALAQQEVPMMRSWLWNLMTRTNDQVDEELFLAAQYDDAPAPPKRKKR